MTAFLPIFATACTASAALAGSFQFTQVNPFQSNGIEEVTLRDVNEQGHACGTSTEGPFYAGFYWTPTTGKTMVPITWPQGINNQGLVVGGGIVHNVTTGASTIIPTLSHAVHALDANDLGVVVGYIETCSCSNSDRVRQFPFVWDAQSGTRAVKLLAARELVRVNNANVAVGNIRWSAGDSEAFVYKIDTDETINLHTLLNPSGAGVTTAYDINENGVMVGAGWNGTAIQAFIWSEANGFTFLPGLEGGPADRVLPSGISGDDTVAGWARSGITGSWHAFTWNAQTGMQNLDALDVGQPSDFRMERARAISENGWIVGDGKVGPGFGLSRGYVLSPVEAPACPGDFNGDFVINFADLNIVLSGFGATHTFSDLNLVLSAFGQNCPAD